MESNTVKPYKDGPDSKKQQVEMMFNRISGRYDLLNRLLSLGIDKSWRRKLVRMLTADGPTRVLDVATGTADLAMAISRANPEADIIGMDIARQMLDIGETKVAKAGLSSRITLQQGDAEALPFDEGTFDAISVAFGVRNFEDLDQGLNEMYRTLRPGGKLWVLEFSQPRGWFRPLFLLYFKYLLPLIGRLTSKDPRAYHYLFESVQAFPEGASFLDRLRKTGFHQETWYPLTFGTCSIYTAIR